MYSLYLWVQLLLTMNTLSTAARKMLTSVSSGGLTVSRQMSGQGKLGGKVALVTASTEGIGYGIAQNLASHGASVMICSRKVITILKYQLVGHEVYVFVLYCFRLPMWMLPCQS